MTGILTLAVLAVLSGPHPEGGDVALFSPHRGNRLAGRVLLVSGAGSNPKIWEGLTDYLTGKGYDVWAAGFPEEVGTDFDEFVREGIPSILARIPGRPHWIGFDAGGLALLAYLSSQEGQAGPPKKSLLGRGVCIACPVRPEVSFKAVKNAADAVRSNPRSPEMSDELITLLLANDGIEESQLRWFLREGKSHALLRDAVRWYGKGCWCSSDGSRDYAKNLPSVTSPVFFISGQIDTLVPPWLIYPGFNGISSREKLFRLFGRINGYSREYGHLGLVLGKGARNEVFPAIYHWLKRDSVKYAWQHDLPF